MMLRLRDMREEDIEDYVKWFTSETEWMRWDAPWEWEGILENSPEEERKAWKEYYESVKDLPDDVVRWKYEIEADGHHSFFTQTWSGNIHMMKVTERLGFTEIVRKTDYREVNGKKYDAVTFRLDL